MPTMTPDDMEAQILTLQAEVRALTLLVHETVADHFGDSLSALKKDLEGVQGESERAAGPSPHPVQSAHFVKVRKTLGDWWRMIETRARGRRSRKT
jgi:hypothetical protein